MEIKTLCQYNEINSPPSVIALGNFDGLHKGHIALLKEAKEKAISLGINFAVFTFVDHKLPHITDFEEKVNIIEGCGADILYFARFDDFKNMPADEFIDYLYKNLACKMAVSGKNYRFGKGALGDITLLKQRLEGYGSDTIIVDDVLRSDGVLISSSEIKRSLSLGDVNLANEMLGRPYAFNMEVEHGKTLAGKHGLPTANFILQSGKFCPRYGVYVSRCIVDSQTYNSITNVGMRPTFDEGRLAVETHIFDFNKDIYGKKIKVELLSFIREEKSFLESEQLFSQISKDREAALRYHNANINI